MTMFVHGYLLILLINLSAVAADPPVVHSNQPVPVTAPKANEGGRLELPYSVVFEVSDEDRKEAIAFWERIGKRFPNNEFWRLMVRGHLRNLATLKAIDLSKPPGQAVLFEIQSVLCLLPEGRNFLEGNLPLKLSWRVRESWLDQDIPGIPNPKPPMGMENNAGLFEPSTQVISLYQQHPLPEVLSVYVHEWTHAIDYHYGRGGTREALSPLGRLETEHRAFRVEQAINEAFKARVKNYGAAADWAKAQGKAGSDPRSMEAFIKTYRESYAKTNRVTEADLEKYQTQYDWDSFNLSESDWWNQRLRRR